jgi:hypothetical protein
MGKVPVAKTLLLAVPYRRASHPRGFAVQRPKVFVAEEEKLLEAELVAPFFRGADCHEKGGKFWHEHYEDIWEKQNAGYKCVAFEIADFRDGTAVHNLIPHPFFRSFRMG